MNWAERERHLIEEHGCVGATLDALDSDGARELHWMLHRYAVLPFGDRGPHADHDSY